MLCLDGMIDQKIATNCAKNLGVGKNYNIFRDLESTYFVAHFQVDGRLKKCLKNLIAF